MKASNTIPYGCILASVAILLKMAWNADKMGDTVGATWLLIATPLFTGLLLFMLSIQKSESKPARKPSRVKFLDKQLH